MDKSLEQIESQLASVRPQVAPSELRAAVLGDVRRELRAARWDRRFAQVAVVLLVVGVGMNAARSLPPERATAPQLPGALSQEALVETAITVAEATDARTGSLFARHLASRSGWALTPEQAALIDAAVERRNAHAILNGGDG